MKLSKFLLEKDLKNLDGLNKESERSFSSHENETLYTKESFPLIANSSVDVKGRSEHKNNAHTQSLVVLISIIGMYILNCEARLRALKLPSLEYRRVRGGMIEIYKILKNIYDPCTLYLGYVPPMMEVPLR